MRGGSGHDSSRALSQGFRRREPFNIRTVRTAVKTRTDRVTEKATPPSMSTFGLHIYGLDY